MKEKKQFYGQKSCAKSRLDPSKDFTTVEHLRTLLDEGTAHPAERPCHSPTLVSSWDLACFAWWSQYGLCFIKALERLLHCPPREVSGRPQSLKAFTTFISSSRSGVSLKCNRGAWFRIIELRNRDQRFQAAVQNANTSFKEKEKEKKERQEEEKEEKKEEEEE